MTYTPQHHSTDSDASARPIVDGPVTGVAHHTVARALPAIALPAAPFAPEPIARPAAGSLASFSRDVERRSTQRQDRRSRDRGSDRRQYASQVMASPLHGPAHDPRPQIRPSNVPAAPVGPIDLRMPTLPEIHHVDAYALGLSMRLDAPTPAPEAVQAAPETRVARMNFAIPPAPAAPAATPTGVPIRRPEAPAMPVRGLNGERVVLDTPPAPDTAPEPPTTSLSPYPAAVQQQLVQPAIWIPAESVATTPSVPVIPTDDVALVWNSAGNVLPDLTTEFIDAGTTDQLGSAAGVGPRRMNWLLRLMLLIAVPGTVGAGLAYALNELVVSRL